MAVDDDLSALLAGLGELDAHCLVLAAAARTLAAEIVGAETKSSAAAVRELRSTLAELMERVAGDSNDNETWDFNAGAGAAPLRDASQPGPPDVRPRGGGNRKAAGEATDAVAAVRGRRSA